MKLAEIIKTYKKKVPAMRFIGKKYNNFGHWDEWFANGWFDAIENAMGGVASICKLWKDGGAYVGLERRCATEPFEYWIGMFTPADIQAPDGFFFIDFPEAHLGVCWIYGEEGATHGVTGDCAQKLANNGIEIKPDGNGAVWSFENCTCPRFTTPDEKGNVILDYCYFVKQAEAPSKTTETDDTLTYAASVYYDPTIGKKENIRKMKYTFQKVIHGDTMYDQISEIDLVNQRWENDRITMKK